MQDKCSIPTQTVYKICCCSMPSSIPFLTFQRLGLNLVSNPVHGLESLPVPTKQIPNFPSMASWLLSCSTLSGILLRFIHSHTFKSSLSSANQLPEVMPVQLSSQKGATRLGTFQRSKHQK